MKNVLFLVLMMASTMAQAYQIKGTVPGVTTDAPSVEFSYVDGTSTLGELSCQFMGTDFSKVNIGSCGVTAPTVGLFVISLNTLVKDFLDVTRYEARYADFTLKAYIDEQLSTQDTALVGSLQLSRAVCADDANTIFARVDLSSVMNASPEEVALASCGKVTIAN